MERPAPKRSSSAARRWFKRLGISALVLCVLVALCAWIVTRSWFIVWQLTPALARKLGGEITIAHATYRGGGRVDFDNIALLAPGLHGPAAEIAVIRSAAVDVDITSLVRGKLRLDDLRLSGVVVRISEDASGSGRMNLMALTPVSSGKSATSLPKRVRIDDFTLEVGVHTGDEFTLNGSRRLAGEMHPIESARGVYSYELAEIDDAGKALGESGLFVKGQWNIQTTAAEARIEAISLDDRLRMMLPQQIRSWWNRMALSGNVDGVTVQWDPKLPLAVSFSVRNVAMTLPVDIDEVWAVYRNGAVDETAARPRMNVHGGVIRVATDSLQLVELSGELVSADAPVEDVVNDSVKDNTPQAAPEMVGVPYEISLNVPRLPPIDWKDPNRWLEEALATSAFELTARMDNFSLAKTENGESQAVGLPAIVARVLEKFQTTGWVLSTEVRVQRGDPNVDEVGIRRAAPLRVTGQAYINDATGSYHKFPYRMEDVDAYLQFTNERVNVEYLQARGGGDSTFRVTGYIEPPDKDAKFHLEVTGLNVPLDERFQAALKEKELQAVQALFNQQSADGMAAGGLLPNAEMLDEQARQRDELRAEVARLKRSPDADRDVVAELEFRAEALDRSITAGPFVVGGTVDVQLSLDRPFGPQMPTAINGFVDVKNAGLIFDRFPYPLRGGGRLKWETDRVTIDTTSNPAGIRFVTASGGEGNISGTVAFPKSPEGGRKLQPDLSFVIENDLVNDTVFAAIPCGKSELERSPELAQTWPGRALSRSGGIVKGIGLEGAFDYHGRIFTREDTGKMDWDFRVSLDDGTAAPNALLAESINARDLPWPGDLLIAQLKGGVRVQRSGVSWNDVTGVVGKTATTIVASGVVDFRSFESGGGGDFSSTRFLHAPVHRSALNMISQTNAATAEELWSRFEPQGFIDGEVLWRSDALPGEAGIVTFQPLDVSILMGEGGLYGVERVSLRRAAADDGARAHAVRIDGNAVRFNQLAFDVASESVPEGGRLTLDGQWAFGADTPSFNISGAWGNGRLESRIIPESLRMFGQSAEAKRFEEFMPIGALSLSYEIGRSAPDAPPEYQINVNPRTAEFTSQGKRVSTVIDSGSVSITPGMVAIDALTGHTATSEFMVSGHVAFADRIDATLSLDCSGTLRSDEVAAIVPPAVFDSLVALDFDDSRRPVSGQSPSSLRDGVLRIRQSPSSADANGGGWQTEFSGLVETRNASFVAGVEFSGVDATLDLDIEYEAGRPLRMNAIALASSARVLGQRLYDAEVPLTINAAGDAIEVMSARARSGDGVISASVSTGFGERRDYRVQVDVVGAPLGNMLQEPINGGPAAATSIDSNAGAPGPTPRAANADSVTGEVYSSLTLAGNRGDADSKRGRGVIRVINGRLSAIPLALQAVNMMQLTLTPAGPLDYADADLYVIGDTVHFEHILFESGSGNTAALQLRGEGTLDVSTMEVAARFRSRSGLAIIRDVVGAIGDMLYEIELTGPLREPKARIVPLP